MTIANMNSKIMKKNRKTRRSKNTYLTIVTRKERSSKILRKKNVLIRRSMVEMSIKI